VISGIGIAKQSAVAPDARNRNIPMKTISAIEGKKLRGLLVMLWEDYEC